MLMLGDEPAHVDIIIVQFIFCLFPIYVTGSDDMPFESLNIIVKISCYDSEMKRYCLFWFCVHSVCND